MIGKVKRLFIRFLKVLAVAMVIALLWARFLPIPITPYMFAEGARVDKRQHEWVKMDTLPRHIMASVIASEDSGFCKHHGVEWRVLRDVMLDGVKRGGSTISQQMVKNLFLWQGERFASKAIRKAVEIPLTLLIELVYPKQRIMEIYLNIIEYDTGVFGIEAAAQHHFGIGAADLTPKQSARLTAVLPNPKRYSAVPPDPYVLARSVKIRAGELAVEAQNLDECIRD